MDFEKCTGFGVETTGISGEEAFWLKDKRPTVAVTSEIYDVTMRFAPELFERINAVDIKDKESLAFLAKEVRGILLGTELFTSDEADAFPNLKVVSRVGTGIDNVQLMRHPEVVVKTARITTARAVVAYDLQVAMHILQCRAKSGVEDFPRKLSDCRIGIIGLGNIGSYLWYTLEDLTNGMATIAGFDTKAQVNGHNPNRASAEDVVRESDVLFVHIPLTVGNTGFLNAKLLCNLPVDAIVVAPVRRAVFDFGKDKLNGFAFGRKDISVVTDCNCRVDFPNLYDTKHTATRSKTDFLGMIREAIGNLVDSIALR